MKQFMLYAAFAATMAGAPVALADECEDVIAQEFGALTDAMRNRREIRTFRDHMVEQCQRQLVTTTEAVEELRQKATVLEARVAHCESQFRSCDLERSTVRGVMDECLDYVAEHCPPVRSAPPGMCQRMCERSGGAWDSGNCGCPAGKVLRGACQCVTPTPRVSDDHRGPRDPGPDPNVCPAIYREVRPLPKRQDADCDGIPDGNDNCVRDPNPSQSDLNHNGVGAACEDGTEGNLGALENRLANQERQLAELVARGPGQPAVPADITARLATLQAQYEELARAVANHGEQLGALTGRVQGLTDRLESFEREVDARFREMEARMGRVEEVNGQQNQELRRLGRQAAVLRRDVNLQRGRLNNILGLWGTGAAFLTFPGTRETIVGTLAEVWVRILRTGPFTLSGSIGFGTAREEFALYAGGLGEFLLNEPGEKTHFSLGVGFAAFAVEERPFGTDQYGWRGAYVEPTVMFRVGNGDRAPRFRLSIRGGLGQSFFENQRPTGWTEASVIGLTLGVALPGI